MPADLNLRCAALLESAGLVSPVLAIEPINSGANNRCYRVETSAGRYALKQYFRHDGDTRDRLASEFAFLEFATRAAPGFVPKPIAKAPDAGLALYGYVEGSPLRAGDIGRRQIEQAIQFVRSLNNPDAVPAAAGLPTASEACFSIAGHLDLVGARLDRLCAATSEDSADVNARELLDKIKTYWRALVERVIEGSDRAGLEVSAILTPAQRCLSPSDFGFHNALTRRDGNLAFLDFEYAGWDDPAKTVGDFFAQLAVPVPETYFDEFVINAFDRSPNMQDMVMRARLLRPVYQVKWCCIAMNVYLPVHLARRKFADPRLDENALKQAQLIKTSDLFASIQLNHHGSH